MTAKEKLQVKVTAMSETEAAALLKLLRSTKAHAHSPSREDPLRPLSFESLGSSGRPDLGSRHNEIVMDEFDGDPR